MKSSMYYFMAATLAVGILSATTQTASANGGYYAVLSAPKLIPNKGIVTPTVLTTSTTYPVMIEQTTSAPVVVEKSTSEIVIEKNCSSPVIVEKTCSSPVIIERSTSMPIILERTSTMYAGLGASRVPLLLEETSKAKPHGFFSFGVWP